MLFLICFCTDMAGEEDEQQQLIREGRMCKGKQATTVSHWKEREEQNPYVSKPRKCKDARAGVESSQSQMNFSQVVDPIQAHEYAEYAGGFEGYDRMEEEAMFYQPEEEEVCHYFRTEEVAEAGYGRGRG